MKEKEVREERMITGEMMGQDQMREESEKEKEMFPRWIIIRIGNVLALKVKQVNPVLINMKSTPL